MRIDDQFGMFAAAVFGSTFDEIARMCNHTAVEKGWWDEPREDGTLIALMHTELSEALEALRHDNPPSEHIPEFSGAEEEFADVIIRIMDMATVRGLRVGDTILAKMKFNEGRPYKHGKKF